MKRKQKQRNYTRYFNPCMLGPEWKNTSVDHHLILELDGANEETIQKNVNTAVGQRHSLPHPPRLSTVEACMQLPVLRP